MFARWGGNNVLWIVWGQTDEILINVKYALLESKYTIYEQVLSSNF